MDDGKALVRFLELWCAMESESRRRVPDADEHPFALVEELNMCGHLKNRDMMIFQRLRAFRNKLLHFFMPEERAKLEQVLEDVRYFSDLLDLAISKSTAKQHKTRKPTRRNLRDDDTPIVRSGSGQSLADTLDPDEWTRLMNMSKEELLNEEKRGSKPPKDVPLPRSWFAEEQIEEEEPDLNKHEQEWVDLFAGDSSSDADEPYEDDYENEEEYDNSEKNWKEEPESTPETPGRHAPSVRGAAVPERDRGDFSKTTPTHLNNDEDDNNEADEWMRLFNGK